MFNKRPILIFSLLTLIIGGLFAASAIVRAQGVDVGLEPLEATGLAAREDIRVTIARIIRFAFGFLGVIAVGIVLYGGFLWMTAKGNEEQINKARLTLTSGAIGLLIILMAFAITSFVLRRLSEAVGVGVAPPPGGVGAPFFGGLPADAFLLRSIQPQ